MTTTISELTPAVQFALADALSPNTRRAYRSQSNAFLADGGALPATPEAVAAYLTRQAGRGKSLASVRLAASAIGAAHKAAGCSSPVDSAPVKDVVKGIARTIGAPQAQAAALTTESLAAIKATVCIPRKGRGGKRETDDSARARGLTDIALCAVMSNGGLRRSEAAALRWADVTDWTDGSGRVLIRRSKTDADGQGAVVAVSPSAMSALDAIRQDAQDTDSVFLISESQISRRVKAASQAAGLGQGFSGHSGRVGLARRMASAGAPTDVTMRQGRWKSAQMVARYTRGEAAAKALRYLG